VHDPRFPADFTWGAATSAFQVEGATHADGRGESIWDRFCRVPGKVLNGDTGDVACDSYHRFGEDVDLVADLGLGAYRFSIAWPRILPSGRGPVVEAGLDYYERLVDALLGRGVQPFPTLYHWDLPQVLEDEGGWTNRATAEAFADYAGIVAARLGDRVRSFATINEPWVVSDLGYRVGVHAPGRRDADAALAAAHHLLVAHALGMQAIRAAAPASSAGIVLNMGPQQAASAHPLDLEAAGEAHAWLNRWYLDPLTGHGYPPAPAWAPKAPRREILDGDMELIAAPLDFLGLNYYSPQQVRSSHLPPLETTGDDVERTALGWEVYPDGLTEILEFTASRTGALPLYITENGAAYADDPTDPTRDPARVSYLRRHLAAALRAIERGVPVRGYFAWSLLDNFEWALGYSARFGIVHVDFQTQERRIRDSGRFLADVARTRGLALADVAAAAPAAAAPAAADRARPNSR
jgi:beta-glucosidase